jgi:hypothetical protein
MSEFKLGDIVGIKRLQDDGIYEDFGMISKIKPIKYILETYDSDGFREEVVNSQVCSVRLTGWDRNSEGKIPLKKRASRFLAEDLELVNGFDDQNPHHDFDTAWCEIMYPNLYKSKTKSKKQKKELHEKNRN